MQMYLLAKFDDHRSYKNRDINFYIKSYMDIMQTAELTVSIRHFARFLKSGISICNSEVIDAAGGKTTRKRALAIGKPFVFYAKTNSHKIQVV